MDDSYLNGRYSGNTLLEDKRSVYLNPQHTRISINVSGHKFELLRDTLKEFPGTRLGKIAALQNRICKNAEFRRGEHPLYDSFDPFTKEYYFQRNPGCFPLIVSYYVDRKLHVPRHMCSELFQSEMEYWGIPFLLNDCCQGFHRQEWETSEGVRLTNQLLEKQQKKSICEKMAKIDVVAPTRIARFRRHVWDIFENSESSRAASAMAIFSSAMVIVSIVLLCINTLPEVRVFNENINGTSKINDVGEDNPTIAIFEVICLVWFTLEYVIRTTTCPSYPEYFKTILNWIDLLAILPFYIRLVIMQINRGVINEKFDTVKRTLQVLRIIRVVRIFKVARHSAGLQVLGYTVKNSLPELGLLLMLLLMGMTLFSSLVYYAELGHPESEFTSIIEAFWWAIITMTTVGYGDMAPKTALGRVVGSLCCLSGILFIALPIPTIVSNFSSFYKDHRNKEKLSKIGAAEGTALAESDLEIVDADSAAEFVEVDDSNGVGVPGKKRLSLQFLERQGTYLRRFSSIDAHDPQSVNSRHHVASAISEEDSVHSRSSKC